MTRANPAPSLSTSPPAPAVEPPHPIAFFIKVRRNRIVQGLGLGMVSFALLGVLPWPATLGWTLAAVTTVMVEHRLLRRIAREGPQSRAARLQAPLLRILTTTLYAAAALALLLSGGAGEQLFALALISASLVHVLMCHYRAPRILIASFAPYGVVLCIAGFGMTRAALAEGRVIGALAPALALALFAVQVWSARAQLAGAWGELMTARRAAEQRERAAQAANQAKSQFLTTMSHELRTPLHGVLGMAQALARDPLAPIQQERVAIIQQAGETLLAVLQDLLDLSKIEAGTLNLDESEFDLEPLLGGVAAAYRPLAERKGLAFSVEISPVAPGLYRGDPARIRRVLHSLCDNAVKFTERGSVAIAAGREAGQLAFRVADTGIGIGEADRTRLFEDFFQADATIRAVMAAQGSACRSAAN